MLKTIFSVVFGFCVGASQAMAAANCNDNAVMDAFVGQYVCGGGGDDDSVMLKCKGFGLSYYQLKSTSNEEIRSRVKEVVVARGLSRKIINVGTHSADIYLNYFETTMSNAFIAGKTVIRSINAIPADYNPNIKRYKCQVTLQFDNDSLIAVSNSMMMITVLGDAQSAAMLDVALAKNREDLVRMYINLIQRQAAVASSSFRRTGFFYVQPKDLESWMSSGFIVSFDPESFMDK